MKNTELAVASLALIVAVLALAMQWLYRPSLDKAIDLTQENISTFSSSLNAGDAVYITHIAIPDQSDYVDFELFSASDPELKPLALARYQTNQGGGDALLIIKQTGDYRARVICNRATENARASNPCSAPFSFRFKVSIQRN